MGTEVRQCCYCGLLCGSTTEVSSCTRRQRICGQDLGRNVDSVTKTIDALLGLARSSDALIWVDSADVGSMREVIRFAEVCEATIHIGQTTGTKIQKRVAATEGWLGASLNEVACHADLVLSVGDSLLTDLPQIETLLCQSTDRDKQWFHLGSQEVRAATTNITLPRPDWYAFLTNLLLTVREPSSIRCDTPELLGLREQIAQCRYGVIVWHADEFLDELDELVLRRLSALAREVSQTARLALVCIDSNPGRVTAQETMLWATGHSPSATFRDGVWQRRSDLARFSLQDFAREFSSILMLRSSCTGTPLPQLPCEISLLPRRELPLAPMYTKVNCAVAAVGEQIPGLLFRGDHALVLHCEVDDSNEGDQLPTIEALLGDAAQRFTRSIDGELQR